MLIFASFFLLKNIFSFLYYEKKETILALKFNFVIYKSNKTYFIINYA